MKQNCILLKNIKLFQKVLKSNSPPLVFQPKQFPTEMLFPCTFFTIMVHLTCHLASEAKLECSLLLLSIYRIVNKDFINWFPQRVGRICFYKFEIKVWMTCSHIQSLFMYIHNLDISNTVSNDLKYVAQGPTPHARRFFAFNANGFKFEIEHREHGLKTQNSRVFLTSSTSYVASRANQNIREEDLTYYAKLTDIIELNYYDHFKVILFKCKWADTTRDRGLRKDP